MPLGQAPGLVVGAVLLGVAHGVEPGHGWPVAATYALDKSAKWFYGFAASFILGVGHLVSSIAMVAAFYFAKSYFELTQVNEPISLGAGVTVGGPVDLFAGVLLIALGIREYRHGHSHDHGGGGHSHDHPHDDGQGHDHSHERDDSHDHADHSHADHSHDTGNPVVDLADDHAHAHADGEHSHDHADHAPEHDHADHGHSHDHTHAADEGWLARLKLAIPFVGGHAHGSMEEATDRGLWGIAGFAFVLGFAHEEEFEIIAICAGSQYCLELMLIYALTVIGGIVALTLLLVAGYTHYEERVSAYAQYLPLFSAAVLILMGLGFISGLF